MGFEDLSRDELATLLPELLLCGHLIDRAGMPHLMAAFGRDGMRDVAIEEWMGASPHYTRRMQRALGYVGDDMHTIFKGLQLDVGAPPQFLDFRFRIEDAKTGYFTLAFCGALADVEPMGEDYVQAMCHDIEDPTMDATALATNPRARMHPVHRPPRVPADRTPHCEWKVDIDDARDPIEWPELTLEIGRTEAANFQGVSQIDPRDEGASDYAGPLVSDIDFTTFSKSALVRMAQEVCLQWHLLVISGRRAVERRAGHEAAAEIITKQFAGTAGITSERLTRALGLGSDAASLTRLLSVHPAFQPGEYVGLRVEQDGDEVLLSFPADSPAVRDGAWQSLLGKGSLKPLRDAVHAVAPTWDVVLEAEADERLVFRAVRGPERPESDEVAVVRISQGASFAFEHRKSLPLEVV